MSKGQPPGFGELLFFIQMVERGQGMQKSPDPWPWRLLGGDFRVAMQRRRITGDGFVGKPVDAAVCPVERGN